MPSLMTSEMDSSSRTKGRKKSQVLRYYISVFLDALHYTVSQADRIGVVLYTSPHSEGVQGDSPSIIAEHSSYPKSTNFKHCIKNVRVITNL